MRRYLLDLALISAFVAVSGAGVIACGESGATGLDAEDYSGGGPGPSQPPAPPPIQEQQQQDIPFACDGLDQEKPVVLYLSADDSNSMASPARARELLEAGKAPSELDIRTYEFLNYYRIGYEAPEQGSLSLVPQMEPGTEAGTFDLQIGVRAWDAPSPRRPITVTFVLDTSGSMEGEPMAREQAAVRAIASSLAAGDVVNMVTWNTQNAVILAGHEVSGPNDPELLHKADTLSASGGTDLHAGLVAGYDLAQQHYGEQRLNRVILISDGGANVGVTDADLIALHSEDADQEGIYLAGIGTGPAVGFNDALMDVVTDKGRGAYVYLDGEAEAERMLGQRFDEVLEVAARSVQVEVTLPWYLRIEKFYGEEYSTDPTEIEPQHLAPGDAMVFNQVVRACDPSVVQQGDTIKVVARWQTPLTYMEQESTIELAVSELLAGGKEQLTKGKAIVAYAEALKAGSNEALHDAHARVVAANTSGADPELLEIAALIEKHPMF